MAAAPMSDDTHEIVIIDFTNYKQASKVLFQAFENDLFGHYYFSHLRTKLDRQGLSKLQYDFFKQQLFYYLKNSQQFLILGIKDTQTQAVTNVSIWQLPKSSYLVKNNHKSLSRNKSVAKTIKHGFQTVNTYRRVGQLGVKKFCHVVDYLNYTEGDLLQLDESMYYKLVIIGTDPYYHNHGFATRMINYMLNYINQDFVTLLKKNAIDAIKEEIKNCDYEKSNKETPPVVVEASTLKNTLFYQTKFQFNTFATIYFHDQYVREMLENFTPQQSEFYQDDMEHLKDLPYLKVNVMVKNRQCAEPIKVVTEG